MSKRYFELTDDLHIPERWDLDAPLDARGQQLAESLFTAGEPVTCEGPLSLPLRAYDGVALDFTEAGVGIPVVSARLAAVFAERAPRDTQLLPVQVEAHPEPFFLLVCTRRVEQEKTPSRAGPPRLDVTRVGDAQVFRARGWQTLLVTEELKQALEAVGGTGLRFWELPAAPSPSPGTGTAAAAEARRQARERHEQAQVARVDFWHTLGVVDEQARIPLVNHGAWPGRRQAWRVLRRAGGSTLLVTDGLSDPFPESEAPSVGFGLELLLETDSEMKEVHKNWPLQLLQRVGDELARSEPVREAVKVGPFCLDVSGKRMPTLLVTQEGRVGVLLGVESGTLPGHFALPEGDVRLVTVKALLPAEFAYVMERGAEGREQLARYFSSSGEEHLSRARRKSVLPMLR
ncbi:hypothetical protein D187_005455 [Cystobacter fuscus DSM 2262]|uniref:Suppressor of fused-like domain-containing protein n=1 Tax=Cystobacter fuscus (strain ATCC 25194 / DSM 2262 / NBRC 100088 / M29) TaxID=1242864 RepID=S9PMQ2_CYSF2|nr:suppressor of fused domain protein [Cystobacter fuscus]EPX64321.1 hypothetical protein D187_005455 [Cystobacter fuscus DSM 2262]